MTAQPQDPNGQTAPAGAPTLRRRAETQLRRRSRKQPWPSLSEPGSAPAPALAFAPERLLHELQVHQVELEMQNAELQGARDRVESLLEKYTDLYDFAPVGYFTVDEASRILEVNLTGAATLGRDRSILLRSTLARFLAPDHQSTFKTFLGRVFSGAVNAACEVSLQKADGTSFWANFHGCPQVSLAASAPRCRLAVSDITSLKAAEDVQRRLEAIDQVNKGLKREITRRQAVEEALRKNESLKNELLTQSREMQAQMRHLAHRVLQAQEEERKRISRELHDEVTQTLVGIQVHLESLALEATINPRNLRRKIASTQRLVEKSVRIVHAFARELRPPLLDDLGLIATLQAFRKDFTQRTGIPIDLTAGPEMARMDTSIRTVLYRVAQAALINVERHAQATRVTLSVNHTPGTVCLTIIDDGKGFKADQIFHSHRNKRLGLIGMRERVEMLSGTLDVESAPDKGTTVQARIPMNAKGGKKAVSTLL